MKDKLQVVNALTQLKRKLHSKISNQIEDRDPFKESDRYATMQVYDCSIEVLLLITNLYGFALSSEDEPV